MDKVKFLANRETLKAFVRLVGELVCVVNALLTAKGITPLPFDENAVVSGAYIAIGLIAVVYACWKNHNFTPAAQAAQKALENYKEDGVFDMDEVLDEIIEENLEVGEDNE